MEYPLITLYESLYKSFGPQHWWPARTKFEIIAGAILTQQTTWKNVEKAIENLRKEHLLSVKNLGEAPLRKIEKLWPRTAVSPRATFSA